MHIRETFSKFFADRGTHLAAMIAYFALLSFVPLLFLALSLLGLVGPRGRVELPRHRAEEIFPASRSTASSTARNGSSSHWPTLGLVGAAFLLWSSLSLFSVLESAFNIVYDRPNRPFLHGKARAFIFMLGVLVTLFVGLVVGGIGAHVLNRFAPVVPRNTVVAYSVSILVSTIAVFVFLVSALPLPDERRPRRSGRCCRARSSATIALEATFQVLPLFLRLSKHVPVGAGGRRPDLPPDLALRDVERDRLRRRGQLESSAALSASAARARCECARFQSSPSSAIVRVSPSGTKTGS